MKLNRNFKHWRSLLVAFIVLDVNLLPALSQEKIIVEGSLQREDIEVAVDCGARQVKSQNDVVCRIKNNSSVTFQVSKMLASCGCISAKDELQPIAPSTVGEFAISFKVQSQAGPFEQALQMIDTESKRRILLKVTGIAANPLCITGGNRFNIKDSGVHFQSIRICSEFGLDLSDMKIETVSPSILTLKNTKTTATEIVSEFSLETSEMADDVERIEYLRVLKAKELVMELPLVFERLDQIRISPNRPVFRRSENGNWESKILLKGSEAFFGNSPSMKVDVIQPAETSTNRIVDGRVEISNTRVIRQNLRLLAIGFEGNLDELHKQANQLRFSVGSVSKDVFFELER